MRLSKGSAGYRSTDLVMSPRDLESRAAPAKYSRQLAAVFERAAKVVSESLSVDCSLFALSARAGNVCGRAFVLLDNLGHIGSVTDTCISLALSYKA